MVEPDRKKSNQLVEILQDWALIFRQREAKKLYGEKDTLSIKTGECNLRDRG
jgi:hypothetical protein